MEKRSLLPTKTLDYLKELYLQEQEALLMFQEELPSQIKEALRKLIIRLHDERALLQRLLLQSSENEA